MLVISSRLELHVQSILSDVQSSGDVAHASTEVLLARVHRRECGLRCEGVGAQGRTPERRQRALFSWLCSQASAVPSGVSQGI